MNARPFARKAGTDDIIAKAKLGPRNPSADQITARASAAVRFRRGDYGDYGDYSDTFGDES